MSLRYAIPGMNEPETRDYLTHHLKLVGRSDKLFGDDAANLIHQTSRGLPRAVNHLALRALVATSAANKSIVDESVARAAVTEVTAEQDQPGTADAASTKPSTSPLRPPPRAPGRWPSLSSNSPNQHDASILPHRGVRSGYLGDGFFME